MTKLLIFHNIASSYYKNIVFNELYKYYKDFKIIHIAETQKQRDWDVDLSYLKYPYEVLFKGNIDDVKKTSLIKKILKTIKKENPRIVYLGGYSEFAYWSALIYGKLKRKKIIIEMDSNKFTLGKKRWHKKIVKKIFIRLCDYGITYSSLSKEYLISLGMKENKIVLKPNVTENKWWISQSDSSLKKRSEIIKKYGFKKKNFIYVGRFSKEKNLFFLLECFNEAKKRVKTDDWGLIMVGGGSLEKELGFYLKDKNIKNVYFVGFKQKNELPEYYAASDILVLTSISEPWGIVVNEAMASGLGVIVSNRVGCAKELVRDGENGFIIDPLSKEELVSVFTSVMKSEINMKSIKSKSLKIVEEFNVDFSSDRILELLKIIDENN